MLAFTGARLLTRLIPKLPLVPIPKALLSLLYSHTLISSRKEFWLLQALPPTFRSVSSYPEELQSLYSSQLRGLAAWQLTFSEWTKVCCESLCKRKKP